MTSGTGARRMDAEAKSPNRTPGPEVRDGDECHRFRLGAFECTVVNDGDTEYATADLLFSNARAEDLIPRLDAHGLRAERIRCSNNCLLIDARDRLVLIDTGCGIGSTRRPGLENTGKLHRGLEALDIFPGDIRIVLFTHLHGDHSLGILDAEGRLAFANARFFMMRPDWETGMKEEPIRSIWRHMEKRITLLDSETEVHPGITVVPAPGHSGGHAVVAVESGGRRLLVSGDTFANILHITDPDWTMRHETDPALAVRHRKRILARAAREEILVHAYHLPFPGLGRIRKTDRFVWIPDEGSAPVPS